jgi:hypothetical protein
MDDAEDFGRLVHDVMWTGWHAQITTNIAKYGFQMVGVFGTPDDPGPSFTYTIGLEPKYGFELIIFGLPHDFAAHVIHDMVNALKSGQTIETDVKDDRWFAMLGEDGEKINAKCLFKECDSRARGYVYQADRYYERDVRVLQIVITDKHGKFPGEDGYDEEYMGIRQPLLYTP